MNKYVVAHFSYHAGELKQEIVEAKTGVLAALSYLGWDEGTCDTMEQLKNILSHQGDDHISVLKLITPSNKFSFPNIPLMPRSLAR